MSASSAKSGLFVTGTDTSVGKTLVACAVVRLLRSKEIDAVGFKPAASGSVNGRWADADALHEASGGCEPLESICPILFNAPLAPTMVAPREGQVADIQPARRAFEHLRENHDVVIVEGVGGVLVPLDDLTRVIDFMRETGYPALVVCRAALGTINHTLLTLNELERAGIIVSGIIMNATQPIDQQLALDTKAEIERMSGRRICALIPYSEGGSSVAQTLAEQLDVRTLLNCTK
jgi:dethiobiotin synthetase